MINTEGTHFDFVVDRTVGKIETTSTYRMTIDIAN